MLMLRTNYFDLFKLINLLDEIDHYMAACTSYLNIYNTMGFYNKC